MRLSSDFAGTQLREYSCQVSARACMNYAAAAGDANPLYFNDESPEGIIAPPLFPVTITWPIIENIASYITAESFPKEILFTQVHYTEHLTVHRPVKPGDSIKIRGTIAAIMPHKAGTHVIIRFDAADAAGQRIFTEHIGAMMRGVECVNSEKGAEKIPAVPRRGDAAVPLWETAVAIDRLAPFIYDGCTNIHFPIHTSVKFAKQVGLPGIIHQGTSTLALAVHCVLNREAGGDSRKIGAVYCRFTGMVLPGTDIKVCMTGKEKSADGTDLFFHVLNADGKRAISDGLIRLNLSSRRYVTMEGGKSLKM
jgi:acyl dehydratase